MRRPVLCCWSIVALATACVRTTPAPASLAWKRVSFAILEDYDKDSDLEIAARDFGRFRQLGITTWRGSISWLQMEPVRGRYDFAWLHRFIRLAADSGIALRPYVAYTPEWAARGGRDADAWNDPPRSLADWRAFVRALVTELREHDNVRSIEIYNEENVPQWWDGSGAAFDSVFAEAAGVVRATAPGLGVFFGGMVWPDASWTDHACAAARPDVVPFHAYPETWTPDTVTVERYLHDFGYDSFLEVAGEACGGAPIWINETGYATAHGKTERDQALWWARAIPTFLAARGVEHVGVYEIKDLAPERGAIGGAENFHLGLGDTLGRPKLAFATVRTLVRLLGVDSIAVLDTLLRTRVTSGAERGVYVHEFLRPDGRQVVAAWTRGGPATVVVRLPFGGEAAAAWSLEGRSAPAGGLSDGELTLELDSAEVRIVEVKGGRE